MWREARHPAPLLQFAFCANKIWRPVLQLRHHLSRVFSSLLVVEDGGRAKGKEKVQLLSKNSCGV